VGDAPRLRLLETTRAFALQRLLAAGKAPRLRRRHAEAVCGLLARNGLAREAGRLSGDEALQTVRLELDNVRAAMDWVLGLQDTPAEKSNSQSQIAAHDGPAQRAVVGHSIVADAWPAMMFIGLHHEATRWMLALRPQLNEATPARTAGFLLLGLGKIGLGTSTLEPRHRHDALMQAQALLDTLPRNEYAMAVRQTLAQSACQRGDAAAALAAADEALALLQRGDLANYRADLIVWRGIALALLGRTEKARAAHAEALPLCVPEGMGEFLFMVWCDLAELEALLGLHAEVAGRWRFLADAAGARGVHSQVLAPLWAGLLGSLVMLGDAAAARTAAAEVWRHMALRGCPLEGCHFHAGLLALEGRQQEAWWLVGAGDRQWREMGERRRHGETLTPAQVGKVMFGA
jgi:tetratricopeptide (TPR) repeat protein